MKIIYEFREVEELLRSPQMHEVLSVAYISVNPISSMLLVADNQRFMDPKFWLMGPGQEPIKELRVNDYLMIIRDVLKYKIPYSQTYED